jgi:hypothetical protein
MRLRDGVVRPEVVDDGRFATMVARTVSGDTPRLAGAQPLIARRDTAAIAPTRGSEGVIMRNANADQKPSDVLGDNRLPHNLLLQRRCTTEAARRPTTKTDQRRKRGHIVATAMELVVFSR